MNFFKLKNIAAVSAFMACILFASQANAATCSSNTNPTADCEELYWTSGDITNNFTLSGNNAVQADGVAGGLFTNNGTIFSTGSFDISFASFGSTFSLINSSTGVIDAGPDGYAIALASFGSGNLLTNLTNYGSIGGNSNAVGLRIFGGQSIGTINNFAGASIVGGMFDIINSGVISTLNNAQGGNGSNVATTALTIEINLPTSYNIIINSATHYGQLSGSNISGSTNFGINNVSTISTKLYTGVLQGLTTSNVGATRSGTYNGLNWTLALQNGSSSVWDLIFTGGSTVDTQSSIHSLASKLRGAFSGQTVVTNFANMNTYDCSLFDAKGLCVSVGGQQTYVDSPSANMTSAVVVAGYKVSPTLRIGGFLNQNVNSNTGSNVDISNNSPLMGLFAVWNQNENHLGYQVKIANAYQDMGVRTTRDVIGTSEAGKGKTDLNTQSYVGELSYAFLANEDKTLVRPYAAVRYTRIKQDGYTEDATVSAPLTYAALSDRSTAALVGVKLNHKLADKVNLTASFGVEQDLNHDVDNLTASGVSGLTSENFNNNINRTRPVASVGAYYMPVKNQRIAADVYYQELPFQSTASTTAYVNYMIGF